MKGPSRTGYGFALGIGLLLALGCGVGASPGGLGTRTGGASGGTATATGGAAGGGVDACGMHDLLGNNLQTSTTGPGAWTTSHPFEGPAVVERSTTDDITLYFEPPHTQTGMGGAGGAAGPPRGYHVTLSTSLWLALPVLPVGARLWMTKNPDGNQVESSLQYGFLPSQMTLYERQGGALLVEANRGADLVRSPDCSTARSYCPPGTTTYYKVDVPADTPVTLRDSESAVITRGGRSYDVRVTSQASPRSTDPTSCGDFHGRDLTCLDLKIRDVAGLTFEMGQRPACTEGNERFPLVAFAISRGPTYDGQVTFLSRERDALVFDAGGGITVSISGPSLISEPTAGQQFWLTMQDGISVLRASQRGGLVLAILSPYEPWSDTPQLLGIEVRLEKDCAYSTINAVEYLQQVTFASTPSVTIRSGSTGTVSIRGESYHVASRTGRIVLWK